MKVKLELDPQIFGNLRVLLVAGVKSDRTPESAILAGAQLLQLLDQAAEAAQRSNVVELEKAS
jgi:hypothetical protein